MNRNGLLNPNTGKPSIQLHSAELISVPGSLILLPYGCTSCINGICCNRNIFHSVRSYQMLCSYLLVYILIKGPCCFLQQETLPFLLSILVGSRNRLEPDFTIKLNKIEGLMEDWLKCQISLLIKYRQNQNQKIHYYNTTDGTSFRKFEGWMWKGSIYFFI